MSRLDLDLISAIYALYVYECLYWLRPQDAAYTRRLFGGWRLWKREAISFTLLGRQLCLVNLLPSSAGFVCFQVNNIREEDAETVLAELDRLRACSKGWLRTATSIQGIIMLIVAPWMIATQALHYAWQPLLAIALVSQVATSFIFARDLREWAKSTKSHHTDVLAIALNPLAAIRCEDLLQNRIFQHLDTARAESRPAE